jgi:hypothetical protein
MVKMTGEETFEFLFCLPFAVFFHLNSNWVKIRV